MRKVVFGACMVLLAHSGLSAAQDYNAAGRAKMAEMMAFIRQASTSCPKSFPDSYVFETLALYMAIKPPVTEEDIEEKEKYVIDLRGRIGQVKWCQLYAVEMGEAHMIVHLRDNND
ncbi:MAG: hypothetical protein ACLQIQ_05410 [Beijerinckiaceae bacterium]